MYGREGMGAHTCTGTARRCKGLMLRAECAPRCRRRAWWLLLLPLLARCRTSEQQPPIGAELPVITAVRWSSAVVLSATHTSWPSEASSGLITRHAVVGGWALQQARRAHEQLQCS